MPNVDTLILIHRRKIPTGQFRTSQWAVGVPVGVQDVPVGQWAVGQWGHRSGVPVGQWASGYFVLAKHAVVTFRMEGFPRDAYGITRTEIACFNHQNVLFSAAVTKTQDCYELALDGIYGVGGSIFCERMSVTLEPGVPAV